MNEGLNQINTMMRGGGLKRIIFEMEEDNLVMSMFKVTVDGKSQSVKNVFTPEGLTSPTIDYFSIVLGTMLLGLTTIPEKENPEDKKEGKNEAT